MNSEKYCARNLLKFYALRICYVTHISTFHIFCKQNLNVKTLFSNRYKLTLLAIYYVKYIFDIKTHGCLFIYQNLWWQDLILCVSKMKFIGGIYD